MDQEKHKGGAAAQGVSSKPAENSDKMMKVEDREKWEPENFLPIEHLTAPVPWLPESPQSASVNRLFIWNRPQKLIDSYQLIECRVSSFILPIQSNPLHLPLNSRCCKKGLRTTGS